MDNKVICIVRSVLWGVGLLLLIAAAFDVTQIEDNTLIFLALACFVVSAVIKKIAKGSNTCCK
ncbi:MAG: hypothetical protein HZC15_07590 [Candidatus Omnitrophica bacterium]|nr:hypothetical protein [Candidatus Omnitrophota bacterium]